MQSLRIIIMHISIILALLVLGLVAGNVLPNTNQSKKLDGRIVGGQETTIEEFPYQVSLRYDDEHICGGSVLDEITILTACHCVNRMTAARFSVRVGNTIHSEGDKYDVAEIIEHQYFNKYVPYDFDMAILKLKKPLILSDKVKSIELQPQDVDVSPGVDAIVSGWGATLENEEDTPDVLRMVSVRVMSYEKCEENYGADLSIHMMCAASPMHDSCQGDSGGPLVYDGKLIGVVSWGIGCARPQYPGVYAKVSAMHDWIIEHK